jgi:hypothetical protein
MVFDFRHKNIEGKWKASGHHKGLTRDAAFSSLEEKNGRMPAGRYMSRPRLDCYAPRASVTAAIAAVSASLMGLSSLSVLAPATRFASAMTKRR